MKLNGIRLTIAAWSALLMLLAVSCRDPFLDRSEPSPTQVGDEEVTEQFTDGIPITLGYEAHSLKTPTLRAAGGSISVEKESELRLEGTRVLVFSTNGDYLYDAPVTKIDRNTAKKNTGKITILAKEGNGLSLVVLTNLTDAQKVKKVTGKKAAVLSQFDFGVDKNTDFNQVGLPMWGELSQLSISQDGKPNPNVGTIHLLRAVARVDVGLNMTAKGANGTDADFDEGAQTLTSTIVDPTTKTTKQVTWTLNKVYFFNAANKGLVAPTEANYNSGTNGNITVSGASVPTGVAPQDLTYEVQGNLLKRAIYVPEAVNPTPVGASTGDQTTPGDQKTYMSRPYLVVEMTYSENNGATGKTFFRIDFLKKEGKEATARYTYLPLLRNHRYKVNIQKIGGLGFDNLEDAKKGPAANIMYNVLVWDESQMSDVVYDGQYMLGVKQDEFTAYKNGGDFATTVQTTWPGGFDVKNLPNWIKVKGGKSHFEGTEEQTVTFQFSVNNTNRERVHNDAYIQAGRMRWKLKFTQTNTMDVRIEIFSDLECTKPLQYIELDERGKETPSDATTIGTKKFYIRVSNNGNISGVQNSTGDKFLFSTGKHKDQSMPPVSGIGREGNNIFVYTVTADPMKNEDDPFEYKQDKFTFFTIQDGKRAEAELTINQTEYNICFYEDAQLKNRITENSGVYFMDGGEHSYYVKSNIPYEIWLDNQMIDESAKTTDNTNDDGSSKLPMVVSYYDNNGSKTNVDYHPGVWQSVKKQDVPSRAGSILRFNVAADLKNPKIIYGHVKWVAGTSLESLTWKFPMYNGHNQKDVKMITSDFLSAVILPEANSYPVTLGKAGVLIPLSRINHAAEFYEENFDAPAGFNQDSYYPEKTATGKIKGETWYSYKQRNALNTLDDDDRISLEVLWTDIKSVTEAQENQRNPINKNGRAPLKMLFPVTTRGERYAFLLPGNDFAENYGNLVFGIRSSTKEPVDNHRVSPLDSTKGSKKALLWSFHIMLYQNRQIPIDNAEITSDVSLTRYDKSFDSNYETKWTYDVVSWPYDLGAFVTPGAYQYKTGGYWDDKYRSVGLTYQHGRKDPFPRWKNATQAPSRFVGQGGKIVEFKFTPSTTISMRESIENPMLLVGSNNGHQWLTEGGREVGAGAGKSIGIDGSMCFGFYGLWGGAVPVDRDKHIEIRRITNKTVFDPCPYGFSIPTSGYNFSKALIESSDNRKRFKANFAVCVPTLTRPEYVTTYTSSGDNLFSVFKSGSGPTGTGYWAIATSYMGLEIAPAICIYMQKDKASHDYPVQDVHRSSPILVRPFLDHKESDWRVYVERQNGKWSR